VITLGEVPNLAVRDAPTWRTEGRADRAAIGSRLTAERARVAVVDEDERVETLVAEAGGLGVIGDLTAAGFPQQAVNRSDRAAHAQSCWSTP
jgi:hypothetical protein